MGRNEILEVVLNSGQKMPFIGFGTEAESFSSIEVGYRHFDIASMYVLDL